jgi:hypothetical protein
MSTDFSSPLRTIPHSLRDLEEVLLTQTRLLASDPDSYACQLSVRSVELHGKKLLDFERIPLRYVGALPDDVAQLLGTTGLAILGHISDLIKSAALERGWPLEALEVRWQTDPEIEHVGHVIVVLRLRTSFDRADAILKSLYPEIDTLAGYLSGDEQSVLNNRIYFDVEAVW